MISLHHGTKVQIRKYRIELLSDKTFTYHENSYSKITRYNNNFSICEEWYIRQKEKRIADTKSKAVEKERY